jgi:hypothetical protein
LNPETIRAYSHFRHALVHAWQRGDMSESEFGEAIAKLNEIDKFFCSREYLPLLDPNNE